MSIAGVWFDRRDIGRGGRLVVNGKIVEFFFPPEALITI